LICGITAWVFDNFGMSEVAKVMTVLVGCYTVYINWPKFLERIKETKQYLTTKKNKS
jgi:hypothetical protein